MFVPYSQFLQLAAEFGQKATKQIEKDNERVAPLIAELTALTQEIKEAGLMLDDDTVARNAQAKIYRGKIDTLMRKIEPFRATHYALKEKVAAWQRMSQNHRGEEIDISEIDGLLLLGMAKLEADNYQAAS